MSLTGSFDIASSALTAHGNRVQIHAANLANIDTPNYSRKIPILAENGDVSFEDVLNTMKHGVIASGSLGTRGGVAMPGTIGDPTPHKKVYQPEHPDADENGFITLSNTNVMLDMSDALMASRAYEANLGVISIVKAMAQQALNIGR